MTESNQLSFLENVAQPLSVGLELVSTLDDADTQITLLEELLNRFGQQCAAETVYKIVDFANSIQSIEPKQSSRLLSRLPQLGGAAAVWLRAILLEVAGRPEEAAEVLAALPDASWGEERALRLLAYARNLVQAGRMSEAWRVLGESIRAATSYRTLVAADKVLRGLKQNEAPFAKRHCRIALLGTVTFELWVPALQAICFSFGIDAQIHVGAFQQYQQEILDPSSRLADFRPGVVILAVDWRALGLPEESAHSEDLVREKVGEFRKLWAECQGRYGAVVIQHNFEVPEVNAYASLSAALPGGRGNVLRRINLELWKAAQDANVAILDLEQISSVYGKARWNDTVLWLAAKQYPAAEALPSLLRHEVALMRAIFGLAPKCLALDLDGVLWGGVVGEDGLAGIRLGGTAEGEAYLAFQHYLLALQRRGIILAVCSKNNEEDAKSVFGQHPEMVLSLDDIGVFVANWQSKDQNLHEIAARLNIGLDSIVFVDDNPVERALVRRLLPEVEVLELPPDPALYVEVLDRSLCFEALSLTAEDRQRSSTFKDNVSRQELASRSANVEEFLAGLQMRLNLRRFDEANLARIVQLINKTNQFNLTTRRVTAPEISALIGKANWYTQYMRLCDRFGDSGLTGVLIACEEENSLRIDNWLMSCRVLGRRIEDAMLFAAIRYARGRSLAYVIGEYIPTAKNGQVSHLYERFEFERLASDREGRSLFRYSVEQGGTALPDWLAVNDQTQEPPIPNPTLQSS
jgi:FkbH-like protein